MIDSNKHLQRLHLADWFRQYPAAATAPLPKGGWARAIREALGMTQQQLGQRLKISRQSVQDLEKTEAERRITLDSLDRLARAMGCRVVYALVPEGGSLDALIERRAHAVAEAMLKPADHSMRLEAQDVPAPTRERRRRALAESLLRGSPRKLWE